MPPPPPVLNKRQRHYLLAAYQLDQQIEHQRRRDFARGMPGPERTPAAVWRAMPYGRWQYKVLEGKPPTPLHQLLDPELVSPGTGSTWKALAERGLVEISDRTIWFPGMSPREQYELSHVSLTRAGRKLVRELLGEVRPPRPQKPKPPGLLPYLAWRALAAAYAQEPRGLVAEREGTESFGRVLYGGMLFAWLESLLAPGLLAAQPVGSVAPACYYLTAEGRAYCHQYYQYFQVNQAAHPRVAAELPRPPLTPAQLAF